MRNVAPIWAVGLLALAAGCNSTRWNFVGNERRPAGNQNPAPVAGAPSVASLVAYLNDNAGRVRSLRVDDVDVTAKQGYQTVSVRGRVMSEKPRSFRMKATALGSDAVDLGSNNDEFWFWVAKGTPQQLYGTYKDLGEGRIQAPIPCQPDWVMDALGIGQYGPPEKYQLEPEGDTLKLVERTRSPQGRPVRKVIVMKRLPMRPPQPQVIAHLLLDDATGKPICAAYFLS